MKIPYQNTRSLILDNIDAKPDFIVVIPSFAETELLNCLQSLNACESAGLSIVVIVLINEPEDVELTHQETNESSYKELLQFINLNSNPAVQYFALYIYDIPKDSAGVGMARKLAMDLSFQLIESDAIICNLDADCKVRADYFKAVYRFFQQNEEIECGSILFEHPIRREAELVDLAITQYELHLRYFIAMQRCIKLPFAYQTIGSAFAIRSSSYRTVGGMNIRKAGEDFYFIHKYAKKGTLRDITTTVVYPSARSSFRVPFGTGRAVGKMLRENSIEYLTYDSRHFWNLKPLTHSITLLYQSDDILSILSDFNNSLQDFLKSMNFESKIMKIKKNVSSKELFIKAFYQWFDAFKLMKYLHYCREQSYPDLAVMDAINEEWEALKLSGETNCAYETLMSMRRNAANEEYKGLNEVPLGSPDLQ